MGAFDVRSGARYHGRIDRARRSAQTRRNG
jgi:hypothetical protein